MQRDLPLAEDLILLFADDEGHTAWHKAVGWYMGLAVAGAIIHELIVLDRLRIDEDGIVVLQDASSTGDEIFDEFLRKIGNWLKEYPSKSRLPRTLPQCLYDNSYLGWNCSTILHDRMVNRGILRKMSRRWLWIFPRWPIYSVTDKGRAAGLKKSIADYIMRLHHTDGRLNRLIGLAAATGLLARALAGTVGPDVLERAKIFIDADVSASGVNTAIMWKESESSP